VHVVVAVRYYVYSAPGLLVLRDQFLSCVSVDHPFYPVSVAVDQGNRDREVRPAETLRVAERVEGHEAKLEENHQGVLSCALPHENVVHVVCHLLLCFAVFDVLATLNVGVDALNHALGADLTAKVEGRNFVLEAILHDIQEELGRLPWMVLNFLHERIGIVVRRHRLNADRREQQQLLDMLMVFRRIKAREIAAE